MVERISQYGEPEAQCYTALSTARMTYLILFCNGAEKVDEGVLGPY